MPNNFNNGGFSNQDTSDFHIGDSSEAGLADVIKNNLDKKTEDSKFKLEIEDEGYHQIPDVIQNNNNNNNNNIYNTNAVQSFGNPTASNNQEYRRQTNQNQKNRKRPNVKTETQKNDASMQTGTRKTKKKRKKKQITKNFGGFFYVICVISVSVVIAFVALSAMFDFMGFSGTNDLIAVEIPEGSTFEQVGEILYNSGVIKYPKVFNIYGELRDKTEGYRADAYELTSATSYDEIFILLRATAIEGQKVVRVVINEGRTFHETAEMYNKVEEKDADGNVLSTSSVIKPENFIKAIQEREAYYDWENYIPASELRFPKYEGYIFPDTYEMFVGEVGSSVLKKHIDQFNKSIMKKLPRMDKRLEQLGMSMDELIILASIIERESSGYDEEMKKVSAILHNRLNNPDTFPRLECSVTRDYVDDHLSNYFPATDLDKFHNVYNTYIMEGLPIGPICNPGYNAIKAALYPAEDFGGYYFFRTDINHKFYYAKTNADHEKNKIAAESVVNADGEALIGEEVVKIP